MHCAELHFAPETGNVYKSFEACCNGTMPEDLFQASTAMRG